MQSVAQGDAERALATLSIERIPFDHTNGNKTQLHLAWENTDVYVPVTAVK